MPRVNRDILQMLFVLGDGTLSRSDIFTSNGLWDIQCRMVTSSGEILGCLIHLLPLVFHFEVPCLSVLVVALCIISSKAVIDGVLD